MTVQETKIEKTIHALLTWSIGANINYTWEEMIEHRDIAIESLKKQIPKKPIVKGEEIGFSIYCPNCGSYVGYLTEGMNEPEQMKYCTECGQHIEKDREEGGIGENT